MLLVSLLMQTLTFKVKVNLIWDAHKYMDVQCILDFLSKFPLFTVSDPPESDYGFGQSRIRTILQVLQEARSHSYCRAGTES